MRKAQIVLIENQVRERRVACGFYILSGKILALCDVHKTFDVTYVSRVST